MNNARPKQPRHVEWADLARDAERTWHTAMELAEKLLAEADKSMREFLEGWERGS